MYVLVRGGGRGGETAEKSINAGSATDATIIGQSLLLGRPVLLAYAALFLVVTATFVRFYEEPVLRRQFGDEYERYRRAVPGWWPRLRAWRP